MNARKAMRKGVILAGGNGSRLNPLTKAVSKQLMPVYDKPMIYYPITSLMLADIREILIICTPSHLHMFKTLLDDGNQWGINLSYATQLNPGGLAEAFLIGSNFLNGSPSALILGDNLFYGSQFIDLLKKANSQKEGATVFAYQVRDPERYGVVSFNEKGKALHIEEKPREAKSPYAITGLYFYDKTVVERVKQLSPSERGELEITCLNQHYLEDGLLNVEIMGRGMAWLDTGTFDSLHEAGSYIKTIENRQGLKVGSPEEVAWRKGWITNNNVEELAKPQLKSGYGKYLIELINSKTNIKSN